MKAILVIGWILSLFVETAAFFSLFHKMHTGEVVFYTGSYLDMKSSIATKDLRDALRVTVILNFILFFLFKIIGSVMMNLLNVVLIVLHFVLFYGGILMCIYYVLEYRKTKKECRQLLGDWNYSETNVWEISTLLIHQQQEKKERKEAEEKGENWEEILQDAEKRKGLILLTDKEKDILENYPDAVEEGKKYRNKELKSEDCVIRIVVAAIVIILGFFAGRFQDNLSTQIKLNAGGGDLSYDERVNAYGFTSEDAAFMEGYAEWTKSDILQSMSDKTFADSLEAERRSYETMITNRQNRVQSDALYRIPEMVIAQEGAVVRDGPGDDYNEKGIVPYHSGVGKIRPLDEDGETHDGSKWMCVRWWDDEKLFRSEGWIKVEDVQEIS